MDDLFQFISMFIEEHGYSPSFRDIQKGCDYSSTSMIRTHLEALREDDLIAFEDGMARTIRLT